MRRVRCWACKAPAPPKEVAALEARSAELGVDPRLSFWECGLCVGWPHDSARMYLLERDTR